mmetsp:Transcript_41881/g.80109  ORF Transcript_41881/g.80109 Transcript_41881/m.80109 type:complete len:392 (+) Transcript_41881:302-1477(+)
MVAGEHSLSGHLVKEKVSIEAQPFGPIVAAHSSPPLGHKQVFLCQGKWDRKHGRCVTRTRPRSNTERGPHLRWGHNFFDFGTHLVVTERVGFHNLHSARKFVQAQRQSELRPQPACLLQVVWGHELGASSAVEDAENVWQRHHAPAAIQHLPQEICQLPRQLLVVERPGGLLGHRVDDPHVQQQVVHLLPHPRVQRAALLAVLAHAQPQHLPHLHHLAGLLHEPVQVSERVLQVPVALLLLLLLLAQQACDPRGGRCEIDVGRGRLSCVWSRASSVDGRIGDFWRTAAGPLVEVQGRVPGGKVRSIVRVGLGGGRGIGGNVRIRKLRRSLDQAYGRGGDGGVASSTHLHIRGVDEGAGGALPGARVLRERGGSRGARGAARQANLSVGRVD